jgi:hypothetical protein
MSRDILSEFGPDSPANQQPRATNGGRIDPKPLSYKPPVGPKGMMKEGPGLHEDNCGCCGTQGKY